MLLHFSFAATDPARTAAALAELLGAVVISCPSPPFPGGAHYVCLGDDRGSMLEVLPRGSQYVPGAGNAARAVPGGSGDLSACHILLLAAVERAEIEAIAAREGWPCGFVDAGLFQVITLWIDGTQLIELTTPALMPSYSATFGAFGIAELDGKLRAVETQLAQLIH